PRPCPPPAENLPSPPTAGSLPARREASCSRRQGTPPQHPSPHPTTPPTRLPTTPTHPPTDSRISPYPAGGILLSAGEGGGLAWPGGAGCVRARGAGAAPSGPAGEVTEAAAEAQPH